MVVPTQLVDIEASCSSEGGSTTGDDVDSSMDSSFIDDSSVSEDQVYAPNISFLTQVVNDDRMSEQYAQVIQRITGIETLLRQTYAAVLEVQQQISARRKAKKHHKKSKQKKRVRVESSQVDSE